MDIVFFEDDKYANFDPISLAHPVFTLLAGTSKIYAKWIRALKPSGVSFVCRPYLARVLESETKILKRQVRPSEFTFINGRLLPSSDVVSRLKALKPGQSLVTDDILLAFKISLESREDLTGRLGLLHQSEILSDIGNSLNAKQIKATVVNHLWDLVNINGELINSEFKDFSIRSRKQGRANPKANLIKRERIFLGPGAVISPGVTIDASEGVVIIERGTVIEPLTYIKGPAYIGPDCKIVGGKIREGCSLGPVCRVGGEVEETIMLGYCNKYHEGFLGHAYLGEWVNLGAMTTNSDLKNNYGPISVTVGDKTVDTGQLKVGCFIGDHTKTGIGTLLNTGISIGFSCNLYGGTLFTDRAIKSFSWGTPGNLVEYRLDKACETAEASMSRRNVRIGDLHRRLFTDIHGLAKRPENV
jgi:UDP-N-acetylglucosamine diphosphorylase/glucosamine-1-phosphate N-acetyltransferase